MSTRFQQTFAARFVLVFVLMIGALGMEPVKPVLAAAVTVSNTSDSGAGSLRQAILSAGPGDTITFQPPLAGQTILLSSTLVIDKNLTIDGSSLASPISISGNNSVRVFEVSAGMNVTLNNLRIVNGFVSEADGGGIRNLGTLTIANGFISDNSAREGGGVDNEGALTIANTTFSANSAAGLSDGAMGSGGGILNLGTLTISDSTFSNNVASHGGAGGGILSFANLNQVATLNITNVTFSGNSAGDGAGLNNNNRSTATVVQSTFSENSATYGGAVTNFGALTIATSTFTSNTATLLGGALSSWGPLTLTDSTLVNNSADEGGAIGNLGTASLTNDTFQGNSGARHGGAIYNQGDLTVINSTFSENKALRVVTTATEPTRYRIRRMQAGDFINYYSGGAIFNVGTLNYVNSILANSEAIDDCYNSGTIGTDLNNLVETNAAAPNACGAPSLRVDPDLGALAYNGGMTQTMALPLDSPAIDAGDDANCPAKDQRGMARPQDLHCDLGAYEAKKPIEVSVGGLFRNSYSLAPQESKRVSFRGVNAGPLQIANKEATALISAERVIYKANEINTSFSEMMGLPNGQLDKIYWLPWYNDVDLDTQLRFANVSSNPATVHVRIGGQEMATYVLTPGSSMRQSFPGLNYGPIEIESDQSLVAAERIIYKANGIHTSFTEMMALPNRQLDSTYWLPWYNNVDLDTQLRIGNVSGSAATIHVFIGGTEVTAAEGISLESGVSTRLSYPSVNSGPVRIQSDANIVAAERVIYKVNGIGASFSEMMALPNSQLDTTYWLPWYNNTDLDTQLRFGNVSGNPATIHVYIGGAEMADSPFTLEVGQSRRLSFAGVNNGPVKVQSDQPIVAAQRVIYKVNGVPTSFSEMMGLPDRQLDASYWLPWYNNLDLDTQVRMGRP